MIDFAPLRIPLVRRLQTFAVSHFIFVFLGLAITSIIACIYIGLFTRFWPLLVLYFVYLYMDRHTPDQGGRPSAWIRSWKLWSHMADYFPVRLHKTVDLDPKRNYIFGCHPHGVLCIGTFTNFCSLGSGFKSLFPGMNSYLTMLPLWFKIPFHRDYLMAGALVPSTKKSITYLLDEPAGGNVVAIIPGGAPESLLARPGDVVLILKPRMGFLKIALTKGVPLVPVFSFGDHYLWEQSPNPKGSFTRTFQDKAQKIMDFALPMFHARGIFQYNYGLMPYRRPVHTVVGEPIEIEKNINPTSEDLFKLQAHYIEKLTEIFDKHKSKYLPADCKLVIT